MNKDSLKVADLKPALGYNLIEPIIKSAGGFVLSENSNKAVQFGRVLRVTGTISEENGRLVACPCVVGDIVYVRNGYAETITLEGVEYLLARHNEIIAVLKPSSSQP